MADRSRKTEAALLRVQVSPAAKPKDPIRTKASGLCGERPPDPHRGLAGNPQAAALSDNDGKLATENESGSPKIQKVGRRRPFFRSKKLLGTKGIATRSTDATGGSWSY